MSDAVRRAARGTIQLGLAEGIVQFVEAFFVTFNEAQHVAALWLLTTLVTFAQNWLEDNTAVPAILKAPASEGVNPLPDEAGRADPAWITAIAAAVLVVVALAWAFETNLISIGD